MPGRNSVLRLHCARDGGIVEITIATQPWKSISRGLASLSPPTITQCGSTPAPMSIAPSGPRAGSNETKRMTAGTVARRVTTVEFAEHKIGLAVANFARAGLTRYISIVHDDGGRVLERSADIAFDLIFLDSERPEYPGWWPNLRRVLRLGGLLVVDNATSHPEQMAPFVALVKADAEFSTSLVPVGNGEFLAVRSPK